jgi:3-oxoacyl-[acyl-carrier protein] reductase
MDLGIEGRRALVIGASDGLGAACAEHLGSAGCDLHLVARRSGPLNAYADDLSNTLGRRVGRTAADLTDPEARARLASENHEADILIISGGWPDPGEPETWTMETWQAALDVMMLPQIDLVSRLYPGMVERGFGRIVVVTSRLIKDPELVLAMPATARLGLTGYLKSLSREVAASGVTVNTMLPGVFGTRTQMKAIAELAADSGRTEAEVITDRMRPTPAGRLGRPDEFGSLCAYVCSANAGFLTGQALVMDGGAHTGIW